MMNSWSVWSLLLPLVAGGFSKIGYVDGQAFPDPMFPQDNNTLVPDGAMDYCQIMLQSPVPLPPDQIPWNCICSHCKGTTGPKGDRGDRGMIGRPGYPGPRGSPGPRGPPGFMGRPGIKGQKGDNGIKGAPGLQGPMGPKGAVGFKGEKGDSGVGGPPGETGPKGDDGVCPDPCDAAQGPPGPPGVPGPVGLRGTPGADGPKGQKGAKGDSGEPGAPGSSGVPGVKGDQGPEGDCPCTDGEDGAPGPKGDQGEQGASGEPGVKGETGVQGEKGDEGMMGLMGPPGPCMPQIKSAFSAALVNSFPSPELPVRFSKVIYDYQNRFIPAMGIYVAPVNGTYILSFHLTVGERVLTVGLFHNFRPVIIASNARASGTLSQTMVLFLGEGDGVWLQVKDANSNGMITGDEASSVFSGYLLHPERCEIGLPDFGFGIGTGRGGLGGEVPPGTNTDWQNKDFSDTWP